MSNKNFQNSQSDYTSESIKIFEGVKAVQQRPAMYLGSTDEDGFHHLVWEIIDNALDEYLAGFCKKITVTLKPKNVIVIEDDGRGIPIGVHSKTQLSTIETVFTYLHAGGKFGSQTYQVSGGLHGVGSTVVNAMSSYLKAEVFNKGQIHTMLFKNGEKTSNNLLPNEDKKKRGTRIEFSPNLDNFDDYYEFKADKIRNRLKQTAFINEKVRIEFNNEITTTSETFYHENGLQEYMEELTQPNMLLNQHTKLISGDGKEEKTSFKFIFRYVNNYNFQKIHSFCNNIRTSEGGSHEKGFRMALSNVVKKLMKKFSAFDPKKEQIDSTDVIQGVLAIIVVLHPNPKFAGQTKTKLVTADTASLTYKITAQKIEKFLLENPQERNLIFRKVLSSAQMRAAISKKIQEIKDKDKIFSNSTLPGKLADCSSKNAADRELFIVEGDSAGGSAKLGRDRSFQAILPLKGKIINSEKTTQARLFNNQEVTDLIISLGFNLKGDRFVEKSTTNPPLNNETPGALTNQENKDESEPTKKTDLSEDAAANQPTVDEKELMLKKLRYHKVIIMTDADVDGSHIAVLLLTFLYKFFPELVHHECVFLAQPPLFKLKIGKKITYLYSEEELKAALAQNDKKYEVQRYKGLGEMNPTQLWETTMNPANRTLKKITVKDVKEAQDAIYLLMGKEVEGRRKFIVSNAQFAVNIDI